MRESNNKFFFHNNHLFEYKYYFFSEVFNLKKLVGRNKTTFTNIKLSSHPILKEKSTKNVLF